LHYEYKYDYTRSNATVDAGIVGGDEKNNVQYHTSFLGTGKFET
jgi:hypothetical protein